MNDPRDTVKASQPLSGHQSRYMLRTTAKRKALELSDEIRGAIDQGVLLAHNELEELWLFIEAAQSDAIPQDQIPSYEKVE